MMQDRGLIPRVFQELFAQIQEKHMQQVSVHIVNCYASHVPYVAALMCAWFSLVSSCVIQQQKYQVTL